MLVDEQVCWIYQRSKTYSMYYWLVFVAFHLYMVVKSRNLGAFGSTGNPSNNVKNKNKGFML